MAFLRNRDFLGGLLLAAVGLTFLIASTGLDFGTPRRMGPAFLPTIVAVVVIALGLAVMIAGLRQPVAIERPDLRSTLFILAGVACFGLLTPRFGLMPGVAAAVIVSSLADPNQRLLSVLLVGIGAALGSWVIFIFLLGLPVPAIRPVF